MMKKWLITFLLLNSSFALRSDIVPVYDLRGTWQVVQTMSFCDLYGGRKEYDKQKENDDGVKVTTFEFDGHGRCIVMIWLFRSRHKGHQPKYAHIAGAPDSLWGFGDCEYARNEELIKLFYYVQNGDTIIFLPVDRASETVFDLELSPIKMTKIDKDTISFSYEDIRKIVANKCSDDAMAEGKYLSDGTFQITYNYVGGYHTLYKRESPIVVKRKTREISSDL